MDEHGEEHRDKHREENPQRAGLMPPWQKGQSGNPTGRRAGQSLTALLRQKMEEIDPKTGKTYGELTVDKLVGQIKRGNVKAIGAAFDRVDGKVPNVVLNVNGPPVPDDARLAALLAAVSDRIREAGFGRDSAPDGAGIVRDPREPGKVDAGEPPGFSE